MFYETDETIDSLSLYADQLISGTIDPNLEQKMEAILNPYLSESIVMWESILFEKGPVKKSDKPQELHPDKDNSFGKTADEAKGTTKEYLDKDKDKKEAKSKSNISVLAKPKKKVGKRISTVEHGKQVEAREDKKYSSQIEKNAYKAETILAKQRSKKKKDDLKKQASDIVDAKYVKKNSLEKASKLKEKKKEAAKKEITDIAKSKGPLGALKRAMGEKSVGTFIKKKLTGIKKVRKYRDKLQRETKAAVKKAHTLTKSGKKAMEKFADVPGYEKTVNGAKKRRKAISDLSKATKLRSGVKQKSRLWLKRKLTN